MEEETFSQTAIEKPKKDWLKIIVFSFVGLFLLFGTFYAGYWCGVQQSKFEVPKPAIPTPTLTALPTLTPTPDLTANWNKYINSKVGFSFKYPEELSLQEFSISTSSQPKVIVRLEHKKIPLEYPEISLTLAKTDMSIGEWIQTKNYCPSDFDSCTPIVSGPIPGSVQFESINRHYGGIDTIFKKDDLIFNFGLGVKRPNEPPKQNESNLYNQILSTFKFLD